MYEEYPERRKCLIDCVNRIPECYTPIPIGLFYTVAKLSVDDVEKFCAWCLSDFRCSDEKTPALMSSGNKMLALVGEAIMMASAEGFYTNLELGKN